MDRFGFRLADAGDVDAVCAIVRAAYARWVAVIGREPLPMVADYDNAVRDGAVTLLTGGGELAGLIETCRRDDHVWIENVAVHPHYQGRGHGRRLLAHADDLARASSLDEVRLLTNAAFESNVALYRKAGYVIDRTEPFRGGTTVFMSKRVA